MSFKPTKLARKYMLDLKPYSSARDEYSGSTGVFLDANENPLGSAGNENFNRYPDPLQKEVKSRLAELKGIEADRIFLGNGSDEAIDLLYRVFCEPGEDHALLFPPTYGMYKVSADINGVETRQISLTEDFQLDTAEILSAINVNTKLIFICSPNNPTANLLDKNSISRILDHTNGLVVIDEAYIDFAPRASWVPSLNRYPNLVVLQTFSKAWGLANIRLGMAFGHPELISLLNKVKPPYNISGLTQSVALKALVQPGAKDQMVTQLLEEREKLALELGKLHSVLKIYPSDANFLLVKTTAADFIYHQLIEKQIIVRNRSNVIKCSDCLRITVGTAEENRQLIHALKNL